VDEHDHGTGGFFDDLLDQAQDRLLPQLSEMPGFDGYYLIDCGNGVFTSVSVFDTEAHAEESTRIASTWVHDEKLETALTSPAQITTGKVVVSKTRELVAA
jgi:hypothetical protein